MGLLSILLMCASFLNCKSAGLTFVDLKNQELIVILDLQENNTFTKFYSLQYHDIDFSFLQNVESVTISNFTATNITFNIDGVLKNFGICDESAHDYCLDGLATHKGSLKLNYVDNGNLDDIIVNQVGPSGGATTLSCTSGGTGASQCSTGSGVGTVNTECSVTCNSGYYACCDDGMGKCKCIKEGIAPIPQPAVSIVLYSF